MSFCDKLWKAGLKFYQLNLFQLEYQMLCELESLRLNYFIQTAFEILKAAFQICNLPSKPKSLSFFLSTLHLFLYSMGSLFLQAK